MPNVYYLQLQFPPHVPLGFSLPQARLPHVLVSAFVVLQGVLTRLRRWFHVVMNTRGVFHANTAER